jgi:hypothetical protein
MEENDGGADIEDQNQQSAEEDGVHEEIEEKSPEDPEEVKQRTVFIGNLPVNLGAKNLQKVGFFIS